MMNSILPQLKFSIECLQMILMLKNMEFNPGTMNILLINLQLIMDQLKINSELIQHSKIRLLCTTVMNIKKKRAAPKNNHF